jgi:hypothetical protein
MNIGGFTPDHVQIILNGPRRLGRRRLRTEDPGFRTEGADGDNYGLVPVGIGRAPVADKTALLNLASQPTRRDAWGFW